MVLHLLAEGAVFFYQAPLPLGFGTHPLRLGPEGPRTGTDPRPCLEVVRGGCAYRAFPAVHLEAEEGEVHPVEFLLRVRRPLAIGWMALRLDRVPHLGEEEDDALRIPVVRLRAEEVVRLDFPGTLERMVQRWMMLLED